jgi:hypothetical protein
VVSKQQLPCPLLPFFSLSVTKPMGRFGGSAGGAINWRSASNTCFSCARVF